MPMGKCSSAPFPQRNFFSVAEITAPCQDQNREQLSDCGMPSLSQHVYSTPYTSGSENIVKESTTAKSQWWNGNGVVA